MRQAEGDEQVSMVSHFGGLWMPVALQEAGLYLGSAASPIFSLPLVGDFSPTT